MKKYLKFEEVKPCIIDRRKTKRWKIVNSFGLGLAYIVWNSHWRRYVLDFGEIYFDRDCLEEIVAFLKMHKDDRL